MEKGSQEVHVVTGGGGYAGVRLGLALHGAGHKVVLFDMRSPSEVLPSSVTFIEGNVCDAAAVSAVVSGASCVYHLASYGMSGREQLNKKLIEEVNVSGTKNVIKACISNNVDRLVYTSTFNVVFGGQVIENGDESLPYLPLDQHPDHYSRTKSIAEVAVLEANGQPLDNGSKLRTCALRLAGVYGPGEQRHLPRIVGYIQKGLFTFTYGDKDSLVEFLHIDNLVQAHVAAGHALTPQRKHVATGQAYFISDCKPVNNFEFFRPLIEGLGYTYPRIKLPISLIYFIAFLTEVLHSILGRVYNFQPLLTRTEVYKTGVTHYFSNDKAKRELGYQPTVQNDMQSVLDWYKQRGYGKLNTQSSYTFKKFLVDFALFIIFSVLILSLVPTAK